MPYFSIITVNKNNAEGLKKTINSVIKQTFQSYEFIIIDGISDDGSIEVIKQHEDKISFWVSEQDTGIYNAMNKGILKAKGEYCLFLNSGDYLYNHKVLGEIFELKYNEDIISGDVIKFSESDNFREIFSKIKHSSISLYDLFNHSLNHQATFIKRSLFNDYGLYEEKYSVISDWLFLLNTIIIHNVSFRYINKVISYYSLGGVSDSGYHYIINEKIPALNEILPPRILIDYEKTFNKDAVMIVNKLKKYKFCWFLIKILDFIVSRYEGKRLNLFKR
jgi:glycosyltransferase involved in cell wall biosynthesis